MSDALREAAERRQQALRDSDSPQQRGQTIPCGAGRQQAFPVEVRGQMVEREGKQFYQVEGYASVYERGYEMWDWAGPYTEIVTRGAAEATLTAKPDVVFLVNHRGLSMARTTAGTLELWSDDTGLGNRAWLNPGRQDVRDLMHAIDDKAITEQSFAFMIDDGQWNADYTEFRINTFDLNRGDTGPVNYGANPHTSIAARSWEILAALDKLPTGAARAALERLNRRDDLAAVEAVVADPANGMRVSQVDAWLAVVAAGRK